MSTKVSTLCEKPEGGKFKVVFKQRFEQELAQLVPGEYVMLIKRKGKRSNRQNKYYWAVVIAMVTAEFRRLGNDVDEEMIHDSLKEKFAPMHIYGEGGEVLYTVGRSTSLMNKDEMMEYIDRIVVWCQDKMGLSIPPPTSIEDL